MNIKSVFTFLHRNGKQWLASLYVVISHNRNQPKHASIAQDIKDFPVCDPYSLLLEL